LCVWVCFVIAEFISLSKKRKEEKPNDYQINK